MIISVLGTSQETSNIIFLLENVKLYFFYDIYIKKIIF